MCSVCELECLRKSGIEVLRKCLCSSPLKANEGLQNRVLGCFIGSDLPARDDIADNDCSFPLDWPQRLFQAEVTTIEIVSLALVCDRYACYRLQFGNPDEICVDAPVGREMLEEKRGTKCCFLFSAMAPSDGAFGERSPLIDASFLQSHGRAQEHKRLLAIDDSSGRD